MKLQNMERQDLFIIVTEVSQVNKYQLACL